MIRPNNYDGYYARAKASLEGHNFEEAINDTRTALEKLKLQQKYQKISTDVQDTLNRLYDELKKQLLNYQSHETTDL